MKRHILTLTALALVAACSREPTAPSAQLAPTIAPPSRDVIAGTQVVANGSFEQPTIYNPAGYPWQTFNSTDQGLPGWNVVSGSVDVQSGEPGAPFTGVPDGSQVLDLNSASISQDLSTQAGVTYRVSFALSENYAILGGGSVTLQVNAGGTGQTFTFSDATGSPSNMRWDKHSFDFTASGATTTLTFTSGTGANGAGGPMLDAVSVQSPSIYTSGTNVMTWDPLPGGTDTNWATDVCTTTPAVGLDAGWKNPHNAYDLGHGHPWFSWFSSWIFDAPWINAWNSTQEADIPTLYPNAGFTQVPGQSNTYYNWTKYQTTVSGSGSYVLQLLADNCSWVYIDNKLVGVQTTAQTTSGNPEFGHVAYPVQLTGTHTLSFIIFDGGGATGGMFRLETYQSYKANGGTDSNILPPPVANSAPVVAANNASVTVDEGSAAANTGTVSDPDNDPVTLSADVGTVTNNGDGTWSWSYPTTDGPSQNGTVTVTADDGQGHTVTTSFDLTVNNVAPAVDAGSGGTIESGDAFALNAGFNDPGADADWTTSLDWGDNSAIEAGSVGGTAGTHAVIASHTYLVPGTYTVTLTVTDKDGAKGTATAAVVVRRKPVGIDIKPGSDVNPIRLGSHGVTPVAVLSTSDFDATTIDPSTVLFATVGTGPHHAHIEDVNDDGLMDYLGQFDTDALKLTTRSTNACLTAVTTAGVYIEGCDHITVVPPKGKKGGGK